jgi:hypothetical protein
MKGFICLIAIVWLIVEMGVISVVAIGIIKQWLSRKSDYPVRVCGLISIATDVTGRRIKMICIIGNAIEISCASFVLLQILEGCIMRVKMAPSVAWTFQTVNKQFVPRTCSPIHDLGTRLQLPEEYWCPPIHSLSCNTSTIGHVQAILVK